MCRLLSADAVHKHKVTYLVIHVHQLTISTVTISDHTNSSSQFSEN